MPESARHRAGQHRRADALWRALHVQADAAARAGGRDWPAAHRPTGDWRSRPDMNVRPWPARAGIVARTLRRGPARRYCRPRRAPVRHPRRRARHVRPTPARPRRPRSWSSRSTSPAPRPGSNPGSPSSATAGTGVAALRPGRLRGRSAVGGLAITAARVRSEPPGSPIASTGVIMYLTREAIDADAAGDRRAWHRARRWR